MDALQTHFFLTRNQIHGRIADALSQKQAFEIIRQSYWGLRQYLNCWSETEEVPAVASSVPLKMFVQTIKRDQNVRQIWVTNAPNSCPLERLSSACSMPLLERIREGSSGTTLSWQCSRSTTNAISELLLFCVCVFVIRYILWWSSFYCSYRNRYIFISVLFSLCVRWVCVCCGYEDRIHFGRIFEELWVVWTRIESIIWSIFTVKVIDYRFRFLLSLWST
jgi:hypothetical protein